VEVEWDEHLLTGVVIEQVPNPGDVALWPFPDLAIVSVASPPRHPCAWLSEHTPAHNAELLAFGHSTKLGEGLRKHAVGCRFSGDHEFGAGAYWQVKGNEFVGGMSGGPVVDLTTGAVCALVTTTLGEDGDRGGYIVPLRGLRHLGLASHQSILAAHDRFHAADRTWTDVRQQLPAPALFTGLPVTPAEEVDLLGRLAGLPAPGPDLLRELALDQIAAPTFRDAFYQLLDDHGVGDRWITVLLRLTHHLTGQQPSVDRLGIYDWSTALAARTGRIEELRQLREAAVGRDPAAGGVISVEIVPGTSRTDRFRLTVSVEDDRHKRRVLHQDSEPVNELYRVQELATGHVRSALDVLEGNAVVEFVVPIELFDVPFDELTPGSPHTNLGRQYQVVLRDYDRKGRHQGRHPWQQRWGQLAGPSGVVYWMTCKEDLNPSDLWSELDDNPGAGVVALTWRPTSNEQTRALIRVALEAGIPAVVWQRGTCAEHDVGETEAGCSGERFRNAIDAVLAASPLVELPERVRRLRSRAASSKAGVQEKACRGTALLWDDPSRAVPVASFYSPQES
jgi:hypothetical protein